jgi:hypothetical protein
MKQTYKNKDKDKEFKNTISFKCFIEAETPKAVLLDSDKLADPTWVPKSQIYTIHIKSKPEDKTDIVVMSSWIAEAKGITQKEEPTNMVDDDWKDDIPF